jgi:hypothetical protein
MAKKESRLVIRNSSTGDDDSLTNKWGNANLANSRLVSPAQF